MLVLAAGGWKLFSSSQEGVFGRKALDEHGAHLPAEPDDSEGVCAVRVQTFKLVSCLENCPCLFRGVVNLHRSLSSIHWNLYLDY